MYCGFRRMAPRFEEVKRDFAETRSIGSKETISDRFGSSELVDWTWADGHKHTIWGVVGIDPYRAYIDWSSIWKPQG